MNEVDKKELRRLAEAATQGEWEYVPGDEDGAWASQFPTITSADGEIIGTEGFYSDKERDEANAAFVASANPSAILSLLDELEKYRKDAERLNWLTEKGKQEDPAQGDVRAYIDAAMFKDHAE